MANHNRAAFLPAALRSLQAQTETRIEVIFSDDGSDDESISIASDFAASDPRIKVLQTDASTGPSGARNRALDAAKGDWVAIVDSDDLIEEHRFEHLLRLAHEQRADAVADNLLYFGAPDTEGKKLIKNYRGEGPWILSADEFMRAHIARNHLPQLGYLKPIIRRAALGTLRYDETLRVGEDSDLLLRFLLEKVRMVIAPEAMYHYRRHAGSLSHRWRVEDLRALVNKQRRSIEQTDQPALASLMSERLSGLERTLALEEVIAHLKARAIVPALGALALRPTLLRPLATIVGASLRRKVSTGAAP